MDCSHKFHCLEGKFYTLDDMDMFGTGNRTLEIYIIEDGDIQLVELEYPSSKSLISKVALLWLN